MRHNDRIDLRVPQGEKAAWLIEADRRGLELSAVIRKAVPEFFAANPPKRRKRARAAA